VPQLFEAVFTREVERIAAPLVAAYARKKDPWDAFEAACRAFLDECLDPELQRIVLLDAAAAIGWEEVRRLEAPLLEMMELGIARGSKRAESLRDRRARWPLSFTALSAKPRWSSPERTTRRAAHRQAVGEIGRILDALATS
jgi:AcrR family transcriptional regulator